MRGAHRTLSGCHRTASFLYAFFSSASLALDPTPSTSYGDGRAAAAATARAALDGRTGGHRPRLRWPTSAAKRSAAAIAKGVSCSRRRRLALALAVVLVHSDGSVTRANVHHVGRPPIIL